MRLSELVKMDPHLEMGARRAWQDPSPPDHVLGHWLLEYPGLYPPKLWDHFDVAVYSLEDMAGLPPAQRLFPAAEVELTICVARPHLDQVNPPPELLAQLCGLGRREARTLGAWVVLHSMLLLPPIVDLRGQWQQQLVHLAASLDGVHLAVPDRPMPSLVSPKSARATPTGGSA